MIYELFGWNLVEEAPQDNFDSVFGKPSAFCMGIGELQMALWSGRTTVRQNNKAKLLIVQYFDSVASCLLVDFPDNKMYRSVSIMTAIVIGCKGDNFKQWKIKNYEICGIMHTMHKIRTVLR